MKKIFKLTCITVLVASCQATPKSVATHLPPSSNEYQAQIKSDKKKQAELDLPFRGFNTDKALQTIAFGSSTVNYWQSIQNNKPELMILTSTPIINLNSVSEYRAIREKVPFMCTTNVETKVEFFKDCPYVKNIIPENQDGVYHSKIFGTNKNQIQVIMLDTFKSEKNWAWLESELKKPSALKILTCPTQDLDKLFSLIKKIKVKSLILLPNDRPVTNFEKTDIKEVGTVYQAISQNRNVSSEQEQVNFGLIKINWNNRVAQLEIRNLNDVKVQSVDLKF